MIGKVLRKLAIIDAELIVLLIVVATRKLYTLCFFRYLCERVVPGNRILVLGVYSIKKVARTGRVCLPFPAFSRSCAIVHCSFLAKS